MIIAVLPCTRCVHIALLSVHGFVCLFPSSLALHAQVFLEWELLPFLEVRDLWGEVGAPLPARQLTGPLEPQASIFLLFGDSKWPNLQCNPTAREEVCQGVGLCALQHKTGPLQVRWG